MGIDPLSTVAATSRGQGFFQDLENMLRAGPAELNRLRDGARLVAEHRGRFAAWLTELCRGDALPQAVAGSYWHPNGFAKLVLHKSVRPEFRIRLHVWPVVPGEPVRGESNPHSHRWDFASTVVAGVGLRMEEFRETTHGGKPYDRYRYGANPADRAALLRDGTARLTRTDTPRVGRGDVYSCDTEVVHTVVPREAGLTATAVVQGPRRTPSTVVYCEPGTSDDQPNRDMTESDFLRLVKSVVEACESGT